MNFDSLWFYLAAGFVLAMTVWLASHYFSKEARLSRRRRRNNYPVRPTKANRPMVKFSVSTKRKKKRNR